MRSRYSLTLLAAVSLAACAGSETESPPVTPERAAEDLIEITYLANEGFLLSSGSYKVLIDGLFREGVDGYAKLSTEYQEALETAQAPFDTVDVALATHHHADHFHAGAVCRFLESSPVTEFVSTLQALNQMRTACTNPAAVGDRVAAGLLSDGTAQPFILDDLKIESVFLHHGANNPVENIGFILELGGLTVLHMGDSQANVEEIRAAGLAERRIDLAFAPFWYLIDKRWTPAMDLLQPAGIVAMHLPIEGSPDLQNVGGYAALVQRIGERFPQSVVFTQSFETRKF